MKMKRFDILSRKIADDAARAAICKTIEENAQLDLRFVFMNALAGVVATYGLLADSTATVIGAMVIATLLGAISGIALALVRQDPVLLRQSLVATFVGVGLVLGISLLVGWLHQWMPLSSEILARTHPNLLDLAIALAGGAAGAYATVSPRVSAGLVGVAIATALVPPIAVCGLCLSRGEFRMALGAFELFLTNFAAIQFTTSVVIWMFGFRQAESISWFRLLARNRVSLALLVTLAIVLGVNLVHTVVKYQMEAAIRQHIATSVDQIEDAQLIRLTFEYLHREKVHATAVVVTPAPLAGDIVSEIKTGLPQSRSHRIDIQVLYILSASFQEPPEPAVGLPASAVSH